MSPLSPFCVFAPGKLMLTGEYVVLEGAPALVAAVSRGVWLRCAPDPSAPRALRYGLDSPTHTAAWAPDLTQTLGDPAHTALLAAILRACAEAQALDDSTTWGWRWLADTDAMCAAHLPARPKLGLGSSAASAAALTWAALGAPTDLSQTLALALSAHRSFQRGKGSGADVAASVLGGLLRFTLIDHAAPTCARLPASAIPPWRAIWTGQPASTTHLLGRVEALRDAQPSAYRAHIQALGDAAEAAQSALHNPARFLDAVSQAEAALDALGRAASAPIVTDTHRALARAAAAAGLYTKPSGAGGGDLSLVFGSSDASLDAFTERLGADLARPDLSPMPLTLDPLGVRRCDDPPELTPLS
jgi:phosphomevalonate kinase